MLLKLLAQDITSKKRRDIKKGDIALAHKGRHKNTS
jgi:hypothetical protein